MRNLNEIDKNICPVCGKGYVEDYDICEYCGWENDPVQFQNPNLAGGANEMSLNQARKAYDTGMTIR